eukprot:203950-Chlamydomonas_euryale.AAC.2
MEIKRIPSHGVRRGRLGRGRLFTPLRLWHVPAHHLGAAKLFAQSTTNVALAMAAPVLAADAAGVASSCIAAGTGGVAAATTASAAAATTAAAGASRTCALLASLFARFVRGIGLVIVVVEVVAVAAAIIVLAFAAAVAAINVVAFRVATAAIDAALVSSLVIVGVVGAATMAAICISTEVGGVAIDAALTAIVVSRAFLPAACLFGVDVVVCVCMRTAAAGTAGRRLKQHGEEVPLRAQHCGGEQGRKRMQHRVQGVGCTAQHRRRDGPHVVTRVMGHTSSHV